ncbi:MAG: hypothetical protein PHC95_11040 [Parabacteroides sp.]|nr:hypothetical protein [Parabacteroides sp.]
MKLKSIPILFFLLIALSPLVQAQDKTETYKPTVRRWYVGVQGGLPFGVSTFSSFGEYKTRAGYNFGALTGYHISPLLSVEFSAMLGNVSLGTNKCCADYFLGADGVRYLTPVAGAESYSYRDIYSSVFMQQYGLRLNIDMMQIVRPDYNKRWSVLLSPAIYGVGSHATIKTIDGGAEVMKADSRFQFGAGADIGVGYQITERLGIRLMSGVNFVMGKHFDGMPGGDHGNNLVWNNNIALTWNFGRGRKAKAVKQQTYVATIPTKTKTEPVKESPTNTNETEKPNEITPIVEKPQAEPIVVAEQPKEQTQAQEQEQPKEQPQPQLQAQPDSVVISFYVASTNLVWFYKDNKQSIKAVTEWLTANRNNPAGFIIEVHSYCQNGKDKARIQAWHVKSHFILSDKLKESDFRTTLYPDHSSEGQNEVVLILKTNR